MGDKDPAGEFKDPVDQPQELEEHRLEKSKEQELLAEQRRRDAEDENRVRGMMRDHLDAQEEDH